MNALEASDASHGTVPRVAALPGITPQAAQARVERDVAALVARVFFGVATVAGAGALLLVLLMHRDTSVRLLWGMLSVPMMLGIALAAGSALVRHGRLRLGVLVVLVGAFAGSTTAAVVTSVGLHSVVLGFYALVVVAAGVFVGGAAAALLGALTALTVVALYAAEVGGLIAGAAVVPQVPLFNRLLALLVMIAVAVALGLLAARVLLTALRAAKSQEQRMAGLLRAASDFHWTQDAEHRFTQIETLHEDRAWLPAERYLGRRRWEVEGTEPVGSTWKAHRALLDARAPFRDFTMRAHSVQGEPHYISVSGEPLYDDAGVFVGYWGIGRIVTPQVSAQLQVRDSERRYRELFSRSPSPLIVHRAGVILAANAAAAALFGYEHPRQMTGGAILELTHPDSRALSAQRVGRMEHVAAGESLPTVELHMRRADGGELHVQASVVRVDLEDGPATLSLYFDITDRRRTLAELSAAREQAEAASRAKSAFLANMTHELRTPLNGVLGLARLAMDSAEPARRTQLLRQMTESAETLSATISDVLDVSRIEAGRLSIERIDFDLAAMLATLRGVYAEQASAKGLYFAVELSPAVAPRVSGDPTRVRQILINFLNNALKFTTHGGVRLCVTAAAADRVRFEVTDTGIGIEPAAQARLFMPFSQADESTTRRYGGSGLGLSICRELAQLMDGEIGFDSAPGRGSRFWVELPLPTARSAAPQPSAVDGPLPMLAGRRVLLAEDNPVNLLIAEALLNEWGLTVVAVTDGRAAVDAVHSAAARGERFDAVVMDLHMPLLNGHDATRELRRQHGPDALPIIALTAAALQSERDEGLAAGMNAFVTKPFEPEHLRRTLTECIASGLR